jgi:antitoxin ParD1/3/4
MMNISLTPRLEGYVKQKVSTGLYNSSSEVIREGLRLLEERDSMKDMKLEALRKSLNVGINSLDAGKGRPFDKESIKAKGRAMLDNDG